MSAHPQITQGTAKEMVSYILSLTSESDSRNTQILPASGTIPSSEFLNKKGTFYLTASYEDNGKDGKGKLNSIDFVKLKNSMVESINADTSGKCIPITSIAEGFKNKYTGAIMNKSYLLFKNIDLSNIASITARTNSKQANGKIEIHIDSKDGELLSVIPIKAAGAWEKWTIATQNLKQKTGKHHLFFIYVNDRGDDVTDQINFDWMLLNQAKTVMVAIN